MYNYQSQDLELYQSIVGGEATSFQWYVRSKEQPTANNVAIPAANGGTAQTFQVPSHFPETAQTWSSNDLKTLLGSVSKNDTLIFTCEYTNPNTTQLRKDSTEIEFLYLDTTNNITIDGVKYYFVEIDAANTYTGKGSGTVGKLRILATNLGVETANAADFGDFYQWGRVADGHQKIGWTGELTTGNPKTKNIAFDAITSANQYPKASGSIEYYGTVAAPDPVTGHFLQVSSANGGEGFGKFITAPTDYVWQASASDADRYIWATSAYAKTANDPCPAGWHAPTRYEWGAITTGAPNSATRNSDGSYATTYNTWRLPSTSQSVVGYNYHAGGVVVTEGSGKSVFLPAAGYRYYNGTLVIIGTYGAYWSSTFYNTIYTYAYSLFFYSGYVYGGSYDGRIKANGYSVRCVSEF
jgi:uncharacterized protein (TIGR02145 family)